MLLQQSRGPWYCVVVRLRAFFCSNIIIFLITMEPFIGDSYTYLFFHLVLKLLFHFI